MERKEFLKRSVQLGLAAGSLGLLRDMGSARPDGQEQKAEKDVQEKLKKFKEAWVISLMQNMEKQLDPKERIELMESCGRSCARRSGSLIKLAESCQGDVGKLVASLAGFLGKEGSALEGNVIHLSFPKCYCELVADGPERLPEIYCHCSEGWIKEMFETAAQKKVQVQTLQTVKRGAPSCKFLITV
jgi:predicted hydrocarbon binding protein